MKSISTLILALILTAQCTPKPPFILSIECDGDFLNGSRLGPYYPQNWADRLSVRPDLSVTLRQYPADSIRVKVHPDVGADHLVLVLNVLERTSARRLSFVSDSEPDVTVLLADSSARVTHDHYISSWLGRQDLDRKGSPECPTFSPESIIEFHVSIGLHAGPVVHQLRCMNGLPVKFSWMFD